MRGVRSERERKDINELNNKDLQGGEHPDQEEGVSDRPMESKNVSENPTMSKSLLQVIRLHCVTLHSIEC